MNVELLRALLVNLQSNAHTIVVASQQLLDELNKTTRAVEPPATPNCEEKRHPANRVTPAPVMGKPSRMLCRECRTTFEEGVDGQTV